MIVLCLPENILESEVGVLLLALAVLFIPYICCCKDGYIEHLSSALYVQDTMPSAGDTNTGSQDGPYLQGAYTLMGKNNIC